MGEIHEEGEVRRVEHRTSQEARRTSGKRKRVHRGRLGMEQGPQGRGDSQVRGWFSASSSDASLCTSTTKVKRGLQIEALRALRREWGFVAGLARRGHGRERNQPSPPSLPSSPPLSPSSSSSLFSDICMAVSFVFVSLVTGRMKLNRRAPCRPLPGRQPCPWPGLTS